MIVIYLDDGNAHGQLSAARHRITRVDTQIQKHLFHHAGIGIHHRRRMAIVDLQRHVLTQKPSQHVGHVADDFIHIEGVWAG
ncbi:MAG: hypothetical protein WDM76_14205 [Limisphaerales bacterium]